MSVRRSTESACTPPFAIKCKGPGQGSRERGSCGCWSSRPADGVCSRSTARASQRSRAAPTTSPASAARAGWRGSVTWAVPLSSRPGGLPSTASSSSAGSAAPSATLTEHTALFHLRAHPDTGPSWPTYDNRFSSTQPLQGRLRSARYARLRSTSPAGVGWQQPESNLQKGFYTGA